MADRTFDFQCPYCDRHSAVTAERIDVWNNVLEVPNADGRQVFRGTVIVCPNPACKQCTFTMARGVFAGWDGNNDPGIKQPPLNFWRLLPASAARVLPVYVPTPIKEDYEEACAILTASPKASATLSRRCLQGMIRDFWGVKAATLKLEIDAIQDKVESSTWDAIHAVREIGNIGAHMEKDINVIVDVDEGEADALIKLIELLVDDWYKARHDRQERMKGVVAIAATKKAAKTSVQGAPAPQAKPAQAAAPKP